MFTKDISSTFDKNIQNEWIVTNGIGGYASSTIIGANTRKYHGLLVASLNNLDRYMVLSKLNEYVTVDGQKYSISSNECKNYIEKGYIYEEDFERKMLPEFLYGVQGVEISKKIAMLHGENKVCVKYNIVNTTDNSIVFTAVPFVNYRNFHAVKNADEYITHFEDDILCVEVSRDNKLFMKFDDAEFIRYDSTFYNNMFYRVENERGFEAFESHFMPGEFKLEVDGNSKKELYFVAELNKKCTIDDKETKSIVRGEEVRLEKICKMASANDDVSKELVIAGDSFIVDKPRGKSIVAGYPWFSDWGRDAFISLEGLLLKTNRFTDAKAVLKYFTNYIRRGLVPNYIDEQGGGSYNTVDASLWYIEAVYKYFKYTSDYTTLKELFPKLLEILYSYMTGTDFNIYMCDDGLIYAGTKETQLTWMDAKVGDYIPTPRFRKTVEVNALWYNSIRAVEELNKRLIKKYCDNLDENTDAKEIIKTIYYINDNKGKNKTSNEKDTKNLFLSEEALNYYDGLKIVFDGRLEKKVKESFKKFYADFGLYDTIDPYNEQTRPNQIISLSLSFPVITGDKAKEIVDLVKEKLLVPQGLKTLSSEDKDYKARYEGDSYNRDISYHQGTVWVWLLGEYAKAYEYVYKKKYAVSNTMDLLNDGIVGNVAEIYDADEPRFAKGALAQAWSVSALLKILM